MQIVTLYILCIFLLLPQQNSAQNLNKKTIWEREFDKEVLDNKILSNGSLLVLDKNSLNCINPIDGETTWEIDFISKAKHTEIKLIHELNIALLFTSKLNMEKRDAPPLMEINIDFINCQNGNLIWSTESLNIMKVMGQYHTPKNRILIYALYERKKYTMICIDIKTGEVYWKKNNFFGKEKPKINKEDNIKTIMGNQPPAFDTDSTMITYMNKKKVRKWNLNTGDLIWESELKSRKHATLIDKYFPITISNDKTLAIINHDSFVTCFNTKDGQIVWTKKNTDLFKKIYYCQIYEDELILTGVYSDGSQRNKLKITKLNLFNGSVNWSYIFNRYKSCIKPIIFNNNLYIYNNKKIFKIDLESGNNIELADKIKFKKNEDPEYFYLYDDNFLFLSKQNIMLIDTTGNIVYHNSFSEVAPSIFPMLLNFAVQIYLASQDPFYFPSAYNPPVYKNSINTDDHYYVFTKDILKNSRIKGINRINKKTGETINTFVTHDKSIFYTVDEKLSQIYIVDQKKIFKCYKL